MVSAVEVKDWLQDHGKFVSMAQSERIVEQMDFKEDGAITYVRRLSYLYNSEIAYYQVYQSRYILITLKQKPPIAAVIHKVNSHIFARKYSNNSTTCQPQRTNRYRWSL